MGDRYDRDMYLRRRLQGGMRPPELFLNWGLSPTQTQPAPIGHNGGPDIDEPADLFVRFAWKQAHAAAWKNPGMDILRFRVARAEAAGVSYERYVSELLDTGRHLQKNDVVSDASPAADTDACKPK